MENKNGDFDPVLDKIFIILDKDDSPHFQIGSGFIAYKSKKMAALFKKFEERNNPNLKLRIKKFIETDFQELATDGEALLKESITRRLVKILSRRDLIDLEEEKEILELLKGAEDDE